jgi:predicted phage replisome organizer
MAEVKWIKLSTNMFDNSKIKYIRRLPDGDRMVLFWVMLLTKAGKCNSNGYILLTENIPYDAEMLAYEFEFDLQLVKFALETFKRLKMLELEEEQIYVSDWESHQNLDVMKQLKEKEQARVRKARQRDKEKVNNCNESKLIEECHGKKRDINVTVTQSHDIDRERDIDIDIDKERERDKEKDSSSSLNLCKEFESKYCISIYAHIEFIKECISIYNYNWTLEAFSIANSKKRINKNYISAILQNWVSEGKQDKVIPIKKEKKEPKEYNVIFNSY